MARERFEQALREVTDDVLRMGTLAGDMVRQATRVVLQDDRFLIEEVVKMDEEVNRLEKSIAERVLLLILCEAPVAGDLLLLTSTLAIVGELEKAGDDATKLAMRVRKLDLSFPVERRRELLDISRLAANNLAAAMRLFTVYDAQAAQELIAADDVVDEAYRVSRKALFEMVKETPENVDQLVRCSEIFHALEHVSDRAAEIAKRLRMYHERVD